MKPDYQFALVELDEDETARWLANDESLILKVHEWAMDISDQTGRTVEICSALGECLEFVSA